MRKLLKTLTTFCLLLSLSSTVVLASTTKTGDVKDLKSLSEKYALEDVTVIPEGIIPLQFNSVEEADIYISKVLSENEALEKEHKQSVTPSVISTRSETHNVGTLNSEGTSLNIHADYTVD